MNSNSIKNLKIGIYRWYLLPVIMILLCGFIITAVMIPVIAGQIDNTREIIRQTGFLRTAGTLAARADNLDKRLRLIDSLITASQNQVRFEESAVLQELYDLSDSSGFDVAKIQIHEPVAADAGIEIPIIINGSGRYNSIGRLISGIENTGYSTRIRQVSMTNMKKGICRLYLDFVIMESLR